MTNSKANVVTGLGFYLTSGGRCIKLVGLWNPAIPDIFVDEDGTQWSLSGNQMVAKERILSYIADDNLGEAFHLRQFELRMFQKMCPNLFPNLVEYIRERDRFSVAKKALLPEVEQRNAPIDMFLIQQFGI